MAYLSGAGLPRLSWKKDRYMDVVDVVVLVASVFSEVSLNVVLSV